MKPRQHDKLMGRITRYFRPSRLFQRRMHVAEKWSHYFQETWRESIPKIHCGELPAQRTTTAENLLLVLPGCDACTISGFSFKYLHYQIQEKSQVKTVSLETVEESLHVKD